MDESIELRGARMHNLKQVDVDVPLGKLVVVCGVSGSGKTSLALDTLYAEGQRRYVESFSPYTRQFLQQHRKAEYDSLKNIPASIAVRRGVSARSNRSTVGTTSEIDDYLRILFARCSQLQCPDCSIPVVAHSPESVAERLDSVPGAKALLCFPIEWSDQQDLALQLAFYQSSGFNRWIAAGKTWNLTDSDRSEMSVAVQQARNGWIVVDRIMVPQAGTREGRLLESLEQAFDWGDGRIGILIQGASHVDEVIQLDDIDYGVWSFHRDLHCAKCERSFLPPEPRTFSFNSSLGCCPECEGLGEVSVVDFDKIVPDPSKTLRQGAIAPWNTPSYEHELHELLYLAKDFGIPTNVPVKQLPDKAWDLIWKGVPSRRFGGLNGFFDWLDKKRYKMHIRIFAARWRSYQTCPSCQGRRLNPDALAFRIDGYSIDQISEMSVDDAATWLKELDEKIDPHRAQITLETRKQIAERLRFLQAVGLGYLDLNRPLRTLSGGEATRVALTASLGSNLVSMLYVLDEPTVGLHPADTHQLIDTILELRDRGNTVLVVEHEPELMERADQIFEIGPHAGNQGGQLTFSGSYSLLTQSETLTGKGLRDHHLSPTHRSNSKPKSNGKPSSKAERTISVRGASGHNLKHVDVDIPLNRFVAVTGVSGSGKSSLLIDTVANELCRRKKSEDLKSLPFDSLVGDEWIDDCLIIDQSPISLSSRSNPATYTRAFDELRKIFGDTTDAKARGLKATNFSFNNEHGRCPRCEGDGVLTVDMHFLADIQTVCPECQGTRYQPEILAVKYRDRSIAEVLDLSIDEAFDFFRGEPKLQTKLQGLRDVGLGYLKLGQSAPTLSAGETQRLRLAAYLPLGKLDPGSEINSKNRGTLFVVDEPTTGLHFADIEKLILCFRKLIAVGHSVVVIEHNTQLIRAADHIIDLGPGAGPQGGEIIATGTITEIRKHPTSQTGRYL